MITKMNYLLLSAIMIAAIDSTFGRGCDCCKKLCADKGSSEPSINSENNNTNVAEKLIHEKENTTPINNNANTYDNNNTFPVNNIESNNNIGNMPLMLDNGIDINAIVSDTKGLQADKQTKVRNLVNLFLKANDICNECIKNTAAKNKIVLVYDVSKKKNVDGYDLQSVSLNFSYCEKHQKTKKCIIDDCKNNGYYITWCGHMFCKEHLDYKINNPGLFYVCNKCKAVCCNECCVEHFGMHIWCSYKGGGHYVCFDKNPQESPYVQNKKYDTDSWVCQNHQLNK